MWRLTSTLPARSTIQEIEGGRPLEDDGPFPLALGWITYRSLQFDRAGVTAFAENCTTRILEHFLFFLNIFGFVASTAAANDSHS